MLTHSPLRREKPYEPQFHVEEELKVHSQEDEDPSMVPDDGEFDHAHKVRMQTLKSQHASSGIVAP